MNRKHWGCCVANCQRKHAARGYCASHYSRLVRHGSTADLASPIKTPPEVRAQDRPGYWREWAYSLPQAQYDALVEAQEGACAVCARQTRVLCVDHDHNCCPGKRSCGGCIRGLLCRNCNRAAGYLGDSSDNAAALAAYLVNVSQASSGPGADDRHLAQVTACLKT